MSIEAIKKLVAAVEAIPEDVEGWMPDALTDALIDAKKAIAEAEKQEHGSPEDLYVEMHKHLNCPHCGGSGHIDDMAEKQEPVAWMTETGSVWKTREKNTDIPLYTHPQLKREWVGLTDEEIHFVYMTAQPAIANEKVKRVAKAIEAKLKEKNT